MHKRIILCLAGLFLAAGVFAQGGTWGGGSGGHGGGGGYHHHQGGSGSGSSSDAPQATPAEKAQATIEKLCKTVTVTPAQKDSLVKIFTDYYDNLEIYKAQGNMDVMKMIREKRDQKVKVVLASDALYAQYQQFLASEKKQWQQNNGGDDQDSGSHHHGGGNTGGDQGGDDH